eukprot:TRINITY_DN31382_c0_g1_i2.p1 TRINITY_DN31382_c0_g1~~TRINITY_DN31382_c0_g1_i2.p1  ORF type:complete len:673 (-),score=95.28 TRINITY_DN31382_c0_g1_i2:1201-2949(-)
MECPIPTRRPPVELDGGSVQNDQNVGVPGFLCVKRRQLRRRHPLAWRGEAAKLSPRSRLIETVARGVERLPGQLLPLVSGCASASTSRRESTLSCLDSLDVSIRNRDHVAPVKSNTLGGKCPIERPEQGSRGAVPRLSTGLSTASASGEIMSAAGPSVVKSSGMLTESLSNADGGVAGDDAKVVVAPTQRNNRLRKEIVRSIRRHMRKRGLHVMHRRPSIVETGACCPPPPGVIRDHDVYSDVAQRLFLRAKIARRQADLSRGQIPSAALYNLISMGSVLLQPLLCPLGTMGWRSPRSELARSVIRGRGVLAKLSLKDGAEVRAMRSHLFKQWTRLSLGGNFGVGYSKRLTHVWSLLTSNVETTKHRGRGRPFPTETESLAVAQLARQETPRMTSAQDRRAQVLEFWGRSRWRANSRANMGAAFHCCSGELRPSRSFSPGRHPFATADKDTLKPKSALNSLAAITNTGSAATTTPLGITSCLPGDTAATLSACPPSPIASHGGRTLVAQPRSQAASLSLLPPALSTLSSDPSMSSARLSFSPLSTIETFEAAPAKLALTTARGVSCMAAASVVAAGPSTTCR